MSKIFTFFKDILAPKKCYGCQKQGHFLCPSCEKNIPIQQPTCYSCKQKSYNFKTHNKCQKYIHLHQLIVYTRYSNNTVSRIIKSGKFYNKKDIWEEIAYYHSKSLSDSLTEDPDNYILIPVPMYRWKKYFRGYNQSELLVKHISKQLGIRAEYNLINKTKKTQQQSHLNKSQRLENLKGSLEINEKIIDKYKNNTIIIVDDVVSTGSTLNNISTLLKDKGVHSVIGCVFASD